MNNVENVSSTSLSCGPRSRCNRSEVLELAGAAGHVVEPTDAQVQLADRWVRMFSCEDPTRFVLCFEEATQGLATVDVMLPERP